MNQILSVEMPKRGNNKNNKINKKVNIKSVIIFFSIALILFGIIIIISGIFSMIKNKDKNNEGNNQNNAVTEIKPTIDIVQGDSKLEVTISGTEEILQVSYKWANQEAVIEEGKGRDKISLDIDIPAGTNKIEITATGISGGVEKLENEYTGVEASKPQIGINQNKDESLQLICQSENKIKSISYYYDNNEPIKKEINDTKAEFPIEGLEGKHSLTITVEDENGTTTKETKDIYKPVLDIKTDTKNFLIKAENEKGIEKIYINLNNNEQTIEVNDTKYDGIIPVESGVNKLIVTVYSKDDDATTTKRVKWPNQN